MQKDELAIQIGKRIKKFRLAQNMSQIKLSQQIDIDRSSLARYELGRRLPNIFILWAIADCLDVSLDELVCRNEITE